MSLLRKGQEDVHLVVVVPTLPRDCHCGAPRLHVEMAPAVRAGS